MVRLALGPHRAATSRIVAVALKLLGKQSPGIRAVVSYSDPDAGHVGTVYQAGNWIYLGKTPARKEFYGPDGKQIHSRWVSPAGEKTWRGQKIKCPRPDECTVKKTPGKHKYVFAMDDAMRDRLKPLAIAYPRRAKAVRTAPRGASMV
jgi:hypothetical protein